MSVATKTSERINILSAASSVASDVSPYSAVLRADKGAGVSGEASNVAANVNKQSFQALLAQQQASVQTGSTTADSSLDSKQSDKDSVDSTEELASRLRKIAGAEPGKQAGKRKERDVVVAQSWEVDPAKRLKVVEGKVKSEEFAKELSNVERVRTEAAKQIQQTFREFVIRQRAEQDQLRSKGQEHQPSSWTKMARGQGAVMSPDQMQRL